MMKKRLLMSAILAALAIPSMAMAQDAAPNTGAIHFGTDLTLTTSYFFRGYNQEDTGLIFQPNVYGYTDLFTDADNFGLRVKVGSWNSFHSEQTASDDTWYESDLYGVVTATFDKTYYVSLGYTDYTYPGDAFDTIQEVGLSAGMDDTTLWEKAGMKGFALHPEIGLYKEIDDGNGEEDFYAEIKIAPGFTMDREMIPGLGKAAITFPVVLGLSLDGYYIDSDGDNETFGYVQGGVAVALPITGIPAKYGSWSVTGGVNYIQMLADSTEAANDGGEEYELQGILGLSMTY